MAKKNEMTVQTRYGEVKVVIMDITPAAAKRLLRLNTNNRNLRDKRVDQYAHDMKAGRWYANGMPIVISNEGVLKDGQHRLHACVKAETTLEGSIVLYLPEKQANCYDVGAARSARDLAMYMGLDDSPFWKCFGVFASVNMAIRGENIATSSSVSKPEVIAVMCKHHEACKFTYDSIWGNGRAQKGLLRKCPYGAVLFTAYVAGYDQKKLLRFAEVMRTGIVNKKSEEIIIRFRDIVLSHKAVSKAAQLKLYLQGQAALYAFDKGNIKVNLSKANTEYYPLAKG